MHSVFIRGKKEDEEKANALKPEHTFNDLASFARFVKILRG
jgi:hypothetical protein